MKKIIIALMFVPFFAGAQNFSSSEQSQTVVNRTEIEMMRKWEQVPCGANSDRECQGQHVYDTCEKDPSHGVPGSCRTYGESDHEAICRCF